MAQKTNEPPVPVSHTDAEKSLGTAGQRRINLLWESTQAVVTIMIVGGFIYSAFTPIVSEKAEATLHNVLMVVITFYFVRTNHQMVGGVPVVSQGR